MGSKIDGRQFRVTKKANLIETYIQPSIDPFINKPENNFTELQSFGPEMKSEFLSVGQTVINILYTFITYEPLSVPSEGDITVRLGILIKPLADDFEFINIIISAAGRNSPVEKISSLCMPYRSTGCIPQVMLQDELLDYEVSLTVSDHN